MEKGLKQQLAKELTPLMALLASASADGTWNPEEISTSFFTMADDLEPCYEALWLAVRPPLPHGHAVSNGVPRIDSASSE